MRVVLAATLTLQSISKLSGGLYLHSSMALVSLEQESSQLLLWDIRRLRPEGSKRVSYEPPPPGQRLQRTHVARNMNPIH